MEQKIENQTVVSENTTKSKKEEMETTVIVNEVSDSVEKTKRHIISELLRTGRDGMESLVDYMDEIGFFTAPASGGNHMAQPGGLAEHSLNVYTTAMSIAGILKFDTDMVNSVIIASLLHDLGKCGDYGKQMYVPNVLKSGKLSAAKPYKRNPDLLPIDHATRSIKLAALFIDLTEDEEFAIRYHDGLYETANYGVKGNETPLYMILHFADLWSSRVIEHATTESEEE